VVQNYFENFSAYLCKSQEVPKMFFKMSYFGLKSEIFLKNGERGIKYIKLKGRQIILEGRTLAMSVIEQESFMGKPSESVEIH
jgi:hypothetical protein